jgi:hypothetical protein
MSYSEWNEDQTPARSLDLVSPNNLMRPVIASFDQHVGEDGLDQVERRIFVKDSHRVDGFQSAQNLGTSVSGVQRTGRALEAPDASVRVEADDQKIAQGGRFPEKSDVPGVQKIEAAVGKDD